MGAKITPTKHAVERFEQRIVPLFNDRTNNASKKLRSYRKLISQITPLVEDIYKAGKDIIKENVFLISDANPPIPITLVISTTKKKILTLYIQNGWKLIDGTRGYTWRWFS
jgi:hypothetical protein